MGLTISSGRRCGAVLCLALAACVPMPPPPEVPSAAPSVPRDDLAPPSARSALIARQAELARRARDAGDLARAVDHLEVLALVDPDNPSHRHSLEAAREAVRRAAREQWQAGVAARRGGDVAGAREAFLRTLLLEPRHKDAASALRELEAQAMARSQGDRAARARTADEVIANVKARAASESYDLDQRIELIRAGDVNAGLQEARAWVEANGSDRGGRQRLGVAVAERARDAEANGQRESALALYEQAAALRGEALPEWTVRAKALRKALAEQYYAEGMKLYRNDIAAAIRNWEASVRFDPGHLGAQTRLREAKSAQQKLLRISPKGD